MGVLFCGDTLQIVFGIFCVSELNKFEIVIFAVYWKA